MPLKQPSPPKKIKDFPASPSLSSKESETKQESLISVGRVGRAHGVQGWVNIISFTEPKENILNYQPWQLRTPTNLKAITVEASRILADGIIVKLSGCNDRDVAKAYTGAEIVIEQTQLPKLETGEYYWTELIGLTVINQDGITLGEIIDLMETGSNDVLIVQEITAGIPHATPAKKHLIPYLLKEFIVDIDLDKKIMRVIWDANF